MPLCVKYYTECKLVPIVRTRGLLAYATYFTYALSVVQKNLSNSRT